MKIQLLYSLSILFLIRSPNICTMESQVKKNDIDINRIPDEILLCNIFSQCLDEKDLINSIKKLHTLKIVNKKFNGLMSPKKIVSMLKIINKFETIINLSCGIVEEIENESLESYLKRMNDDIDFYLKYIKPGLDNFDTHIVASWLSAFNKRLEAKMKQERKELNAP